MSDLKGDEGVHWTEQSVDSFVHRITFDFTTQIEQAVPSQDELARKLGVTEGRVSQILNSSSISLKNIVKSARAIGRKVALVLYDDDDPSNTNGPVSSQIFSVCWERAGKPTDFFALEALSDSPRTALEKGAEQDGQSTQDGAKQKGNCSPLGEKE